MDFFAKKLENFSDLERRALEYQIVTLYARKTCILNSKTGEVKLVHYFPYNGIPDSLPAKGGVTKSLSDGAISYAIRGVETKVGDDDNSTKEVSSQTEFPYSPVVEEIKETDDTKMKWKHTAKKKQVKVPSVHESISLMIAQFELAVREEELMHAREKELKQFRDKEMKYLREKELMHAREKELMHPREEQLMHAREKELTNQKTHTHPQSSSQPMSQMKADTPVRRPWYIRLFVCGHASTGQETREQKNGRAGNGFLRRLRRIFRRIK